MEKKKIKILGAGISGMVAAITLARNGYNVEIFEKRSRIGSFFERDVHSLRNYLYKYDVIEKYKELGVEIPYVYPIFKEFRFSPLLKKIEIYSNNKPLFYNFIRGHKDKKSFDIALYKTAKKLGVKFYFNRSLDDKKVDIIATGAFSKKGAGYGRHYSNIKNFIPSSLHVFLDNRYSDRGYCYIVPFYDEVSILITSTKEKNKEKLKKKFNDLIKENSIIKKILKKAKFENEVLGYASYKLPKTATKDNKLFIGEAAGFLDAARGFGTHYAILSGYLAAVSITENKNYDNLWKNSFGKELKFEHSRRNKFEKLHNNDYDNMIDGLVKKYGERVPVDTYKSLKLN